MEADAEGKIINCEGDTLNNVIRVHTTRLNSISMHTLSDTLLADTSHIKLEIEERYEWYVKGYRYPMYETTSICFYDNMTPVSYIHKAYLLIHHLYVLFHLKPWYHIYILPHHKMVVALLGENIL